MKASKNQADAVRSYLSSIGHDITHVQALEVIARGAGLRSRHVKGARASSAISLVMNTCNHCGNDLVRGYCKDQTCVYSDWPQAVDREDVFSLSTAAVEKKYNVKRRDAETEHPVDIETMGVDLRFQFGDDGSHPAHARDEWTEWLAARNTHPDTMSYWSWVAAKLTFGDDLDNVGHVYCLSISSEDYGMQTYTYFDAATRESRLPVFLASFASQMDSDWTVRFYDYNPGREEGGGHFNRGEVQAVVSAEGVIYYRGQTFLSPKIETVDGKPTFIPEGGVKSDVVAGKDRVDGSDEDRERSPSSIEAGAPSARASLLCLDMDGVIVPDPEMKELGEQLFGSQVSAPTAATKDVKAKLCRYNILMESEEFGTDVCSYATPEEREMGLMRLLGNVVLDGDNIERRYWRYERELVAGDQVRIYAPSSVSKDKDAYGKVKSIDYAARRFVVEVDRVDVPFEFEMFAMMTMPFVDRITHVETMNITRTPANAVYTEDCDVVLDGRHYNNREIRFRKMRDGRYFAPKK